MAGGGGPSRDPWDMATPVDVGPQLESRAPRCASRGRTPTFLPDCLHRHPFLLAPASCSWQGLCWGFRPEEVTWLSREDVLCVLNLSSSRTSPGAPGSCGSTCCRDAVRGPARDRLPSVATAQGVEGCSLEEGPGTALGRVPIRVFSFGHPQSRTRLDSTRRVSAAAGALGAWRMNNHAQGRRHSASPGRHSQHQAGTGRGKAGLYHLPLSSYKS